ncbi:unnamed protein product, partial [Effrenium voratum]
KGPVGKVADPLHGLALQLAEIRLLPLCEKMRALSQFLASAQPFLAKMGPDLKFARSTVQEYLRAMVSLRLTNVDNRHDRGSKTMRFVAVSILWRARIATPSLTDLLYCAYIAVLTGGRRFAEYLQQGWQNNHGLEGTALHQMYQEEASNGWSDPPCCPENSGDEGQDEAEDADADVLVDAGNEDLVSDKSKHLLTTALELVERFREQHPLWADISHRGFRPAKALGYPKLVAILQRVRDMKTPVIKSGYSIQEILLSTGFPFLRCQGLVAKVVVDRWDELAQGSVYHCDPNWMAVPRVGCCREYLEILQGSNAAFGVGGWPSGGAPVDTGTLAFLRNLRKRLAKAAKASFPEVQKLLVSDRGLSIVENCLCCGMKPIHVLLKVNNHRLYSGSLSDRQL